MITFITKEYKKQDPGLGRWPNHCEPLLVPLQGTGVLFPVLFWPPWIPDTHVIVYIHIHRQTTHIHKISKIVYEGK